MRIWEMTSELVEDPQTGSGRNLDVEGVPEAHLHIPTTNKMAMIKGILHYRRYTLRELLGLDIKGVERIWKEIQSTHPAWVERNKSAGEMRSLGNTGWVKLAFALKAKRKEQGI